MRGQSHVVGVALLLGITVVALSGLTLAAGTLVDAGTASADATRVADELDAALQPVATTGPRVGRLHFTDGRLSTADREVRILDNGSAVESHSVDALVFEAQDRRVAFVAGAVVRGRGSSAWFVSEPPISASERNPVLVAGAPRLGAGHVTTGGTGGTSVALQTNVSHARTDLGHGNYAVTVETATPQPFERYFTNQNASVVRRDFDGDGVESVVAAYPGQRRGYVVVHNLSLEVAHG